MLRHQIFQAGDLSVRGAGGDQAKRIRDLNREGVFHLVLIGNAEQGEGGRRRLGVPFRFDSGQFGFLHVAHFVAGFITQNDNGQNGSHTKAGSDGEGALGKGDVAAFQQIVGTDTQHEHRAAGVAGSHGVNEFHLRNRVKHQFGEADHLHAHGFEVEIRSDRVLHPAVGDQDPQRGQVGAESHEPGYRHVLYLAQTIPAEEEQADQRRFKEERHQTFDSQRGPEDIADVVREIRPVSPELELHGQTGGHTQSKVNRK